MATPKNTILKESDFKQLADLVECAESLSSIADTMAEQDGPNIEALAYFARILKQKSIAFHAGLDSRNDPEGGAE